MMAVAADETAPGTSIAKAEARAAAGRYGEALAITEQALAANPHDFDLLAARASVLFGWGRFREAREAYLPIAAQSALGLQACIQLGWLHSFVGQPGEAVAWMRKAAAMEPSTAEAQHGLASLLLREGRLAEAIALSSAASRRWPKDARFFLCLGQCHLREGMAAEAEAQFRRVVDLEPGQPTAWLSLGLSLRSQDRRTEALEAFEHAMRLASEVDEASDAFVEVATEHQLAGQNEEAAAVLEANLPHRPSIEGHRCYAEALLATGRLNEGWQHYEFRWLAEPLLSIRWHTPFPQWSGEPLASKTILLRPEQGFGDVIMALRYAPFVKALGATVLLRRFSDLAHDFPGVDRVLPEDAPSQDFDWYIPVMSLPRVFGTEVASIPANVPYLRVEPTRAERWRKRLEGDTRFKVGLAWAGRPSHPWDRYRSTALDGLAALWAVQGVRFVSLQKGQTAQVEAFSTAHPLLDLGRELADFADTAAVISQLDLVICVDTAVAHLAGALGKPVWVLLSQPTDWRWLEEREDTPWYPTMRLFRQHKAGDWPGVVARVRAALEQRLRKDPEQEPIAGKPTASIPVPVASTLARLAPGHRPGFSAVAEMRVGIVQYFPDEPDVGDSISWYGEYLQPQLDLLGRLIKPGMTVMEIGAGVGMHALHLAVVISPAGHLFLYEARALHRRVLRQNLAANRVGNATLMRRTLGATPERADYSRETVDELHLKQLHLLKIGEDAPAPDVLAGARETLWRLRPALCIAASDPAELRELTTLAKDLGYRCWKLETPLFNPDNFNRRGSDIFSGRKTSALFAIAEELETDFPLAGCAEL